jgi:hypothetical protein
MRRREKQNEPWVGFVKDVCFDSIYAEITKQFD